MFTYDKQKKEDFIIIYNNDNLLQQNMIWWLLNRNKWACVLVYLHVKHQMAHTIVTFLILIICQRRIMDGLLGFNVSLSQ